jgi:LysM repeat protein
MCNASHQSYNNSGYPFFWNEEDETMFMRRTLQITLVMAVLAASLFIPHGVSAAGPCGNIYIVQPGDWLIKIAERCGVTLQALYNANPGVAWQPYIYPGQALNIPGGGYPPPPPLPGSGGPINGCPNPFCQVYGAPGPGNGILYFWYPSIVVTPTAGGSYYQATLRVNQLLTFQARVRNNGDVPLQVVANLDTPAGWDLGEVYKDCPDVLHVGAVCTLSWEFTPRVPGSVLLRVYARGFYTDPYGSQQRVTDSPGFVINVY